MAQAKPICINPTTLPVFNVIPDLGASALPAPRLAQQRPAFLRGVDRAFLLMVVGSSAPPLYRLLDAAPPIEIHLEDFLLDVDIRSVLVHGLHPPETVVRAVLERTSCWALRRRMAALSPQTSHQVKAALRHADGQFDWPVQQIFTDLPSPSGHSVVGSTLSQPALALLQVMPVHHGSTIVYAQRRSERVADVRWDAAIGSHALIGRAAFELLPHGRAIGLLRSCPRVERWHPSRTQRAPVIPAAVTGGQWPSDARALVRSLVVPRILAGGGRGDSVECLTDLPEFGESEPLLLAAVALARSRLDAADSALRRAESELAQAQPPETTDLLSFTLLRLAASSLQGDAAAGLMAASGLKDLMGRLTAAERERAPELSPLIDYYVASCEWSLGRLNTARSRLQNAASNFEASGDHEVSVEQLVRANCAGQLAWLDAFCGNLRRSMRYATAVLTIRRADTNEIGVRFAHLAAVLVHMERCEIEQAKQRLSHAVGLSTDKDDPLLTAAQLLTQVRLTRVTDGPSAALRQLGEAARPGNRGSVGWFGEQFALATAGACLAAGEARGAIDVLAGVAHSAGGEGSLLLARAHRVLGDLHAAEATLAEPPSTSAGDTLITAVRHWLLLAQLHTERNDIQAAGHLVDQALSAAANEDLVETVREADGWLRSFVARDSRLLRRHSSFLRSVGYETPPQMRPRPETARLADGLISVPLTARETDVLNLLADYCSNEEIAADMVVSMNTVKTHIRSLFQKLSVTRRGDAVRRGRGLGLC